MADTEKRQFWSEVKDNSLCQTHSLSPERPTVRTVNALCGEDCSSWVMCLRNFAENFSTMEKKHFVFASVRNLAERTGWSLKFMQMSCKINLQTWYPFFNNQLNISLLMMPNTQAQYSTIIKFFLKTCNWKIKKFSLRDGSGLQFNLIQGLGFLLIPSTDHLWEMLEQNKEEMAEQRGKKPELQHVCSFL